MVRLTLSPISCPYSVVRPKSDAVLEESLTYYMLLDYQLSSRTLFERC